MEKATHDSISLLLCWLRNFTEASRRTRKASAKTSITEESSSTLEYLIYTIVYTVNIYTHMLSHN